MKRSTVVAVVTIAALVQAACAGSNDDDSAVADTNQPALGGTTAITTPPTAPPATERTTTTTAPAPPDTAAASVDATVDKAALQTILDQWRTGLDAFGATLSIRVPGNDDIHLASGIDDRNPDTPMPTDGTFGTGTITRSFVAAAALQLVDEGRLSLDQVVEPWLPELPNADQITVAMLLGFTSGLPQVDAPDAQDMVLADLTRRFTPEELLAEHLKRQPTRPPGEGVAGVDTGYVAAGLLIERVLGRDLTAVIDKRLIKPLSLNDTSLSDGSVRPTRHGWFSLDGDPDRPLDFLDFPHQAVMTSNWASRNMISSSEDLLDWGETLYTGGLLSEASTATMLEMRDLDLPGYYYGLGAEGFCFDQTACTPDDVDLVGHVGGFIVGIESLVVHHPDSGTTVVIHANDNSGFTDEAAQLVDLVEAALQSLGLV
jgi:D-alanyl-D-alanine carboxypeptidase